MAFTVLETSYSYLETQFTAVTTSYSHGLLPVAVSILTAGGILYFVIYGIMVLRGAIATPLSDLAMAALKFGIVVGLVGSTGFTNRVITAANALPGQLITAGGDTQPGNPGKAMDDYFERSKNLMNIVQAKWDKDKADMTGSSSVASGVGNWFGQGPGQAVAAVMDPGQAINLAVEEAVEFVLVIIVMLIAGLSACVGFVIYIFALLGLDVVLALTPIAIGCVLFAQTRWIFQGWISQLLNYVFLMVIISVITRIVLALSINAMTDIVGVSSTTGAAGQALNVATNGASVIFTSEAEVLAGCIAVAAVYILGTLFFLQAPNIASAIFGGAASGGHNFITAVGNRVASRVARGFSRGGSGGGGGRNSVSRR